MQRQRNVRKLFHSLREILKDMGLLEPISVARKIISSGVLHFFVIGICIIWLLPSIGLFVSSFRPRHLVATSPWWNAFKTPFRFTLDNYIRVLTRANMGRSFINSLLITIPATVIPVLIAAFAAYAFSWMKFPGRDLLFLLVVALLVVPLQMTLIPVLRMFRKLHLIQTFPGIWLAHSAYDLPFATYLLRNFIGKLPGEMFESAKIDGASHPVIFFRFVLPTSVPAIASLSIFHFLWVWNDLLVALVYLGGTPGVAPVSVQVANITNSYGQNWELLTSAAFISMALPLVVFLALQKYFVRGIVEGSVKG